MLRAAYGIQLFFIISAIVIAESYEARKQIEKHPAINFYIRRFFRIAPIFYFYILINFLVYGFGVRHQAPDGTNCFSYILTGLFLSGWHPTTINAAVDGAWSITGEIFFYLLFPLFYRRWFSTKKILWLLIITIVLNELIIIFSIKYSHIISDISQKGINFFNINYLPSNFDRAYSILLSDFLYYWFPAQIPIFLMGCMCYKVIQWNRINPSIGKSYSPILLSLAIIGMALCSKGSFNRLPVHFVYGFFLSFFVLSIKFRRYAIIENRFIAFIGKRSLSLFLNHIILLDVYRRWLLGINPHFFINPHPLELFAFLIGAFITFMFAAEITYQFFEKTGIRVGNYLAMLLELRAIKRCEN